MSNNCDDNITSEDMINPVILPDDKTTSGSEKSTLEIDPNTNKTETLSDVITQTDRDGKSKNRISTGTSNTTSTSETDGSNENSIFNYLCCCFYHDDRKSSRSTELTRPSSARNPIAYATPKRFSISGQSKLLPSRTENTPKKCLALDLDETLVHSSFQYVANADFVIPVAIEDMIHNVYVLKRPGVDQFMKRMGEIYEIVIYTASLSKYADPLLDKLDIHKVINHRLFRESCVYHDGHYVKDLSLLNRDVSQCIIVDNSPMSYIFHPDYAIDCSSFIDDPNDVEMWQIADFLEDLNKFDDVRGRTRLWKQWCQRNPNLSVPKR